MTLLNYTDPIPLPPLVTSGSAIQSYTDPIGDVWVAANGVNGGAWRRARDVLHSRSYRAAAATITATLTAIAFDTVVRDPYGLLTGGSCTVPVPGIYSVTTGTGGLSSTANQGLQVYTSHNGVGSLAQMVNLISGYYGYVRATDIVFCNAGDTLGGLVYVFTGTLTMQTGSNTTTLAVDYLGTG
jgi:hypothetical protein